MIQEKVADRWQDILQLIEGLWPTRYDKELTPDLLSVWKRKLANYPYDLIRHILEDHAADSRFFPRVGEIIKQADQVVYGKKLTQNSNESLAKIESERRECDASWQLVYAILADLTPQQLEMHKKVMLEQDWRLEWMRGYGVDTRHWAGLIASRVQKGLRPDQHDPDLEPPSRPEPNDAILMAMLPDI